MDDFRGQEIFKSQSEIVNTEAVSLPARFSLIFFSIICPLLRLFFLSTCSTSLRRPIRCWLDRYFRGKKVSHVMYMMLTQYTAAVIPTLSPSKVYTPSISAVLLPLPFHPYPTHGSY